MEIEIFIAEILTKMNVDDTVKISNNFGVTKVSDTDFRIVNLKTVEDIHKNTIFTLEENGHIKLNE